MLHRYVRHYARFVVGVALAVLLATGAVALGPRTALRALQWQRTPSPPASATARATSTPWATITPTMGATLTVTLTPSVTPAETSTPTLVSTPSPTAPVAAMPTAVVMPSAAPTLMLAPQPLPTPDGKARTVRVPILMYHYISDPPADADAYRLDLSVRPRDLEAQLAYLQAAGYTGIGLGDLVRYLAVGDPLPAKPIIITFDDGYVDNFVYAFPLLCRYNFRGTFFLVTDFLDQGMSGYITWEQVQLMADKGMDIESHGLDHSDLQGRTAADQLQQVKRSREVIEAHVHQPVHFFAYPFGRYDERTIAALREAGYSAAVNTLAGVTHTSGGLFDLRRIRIHGGDGLDKFTAVLDYYQ